MYQAKYVILIVIGLALFIAGPFMVGVGASFTFDYPLTIYVAMYWAVGVFASIQEIYTLRSRSEYRVTRFSLLKKQECELLFAGFILLIGGLGFFAGMVMELFSTPSLEQTQVSKKAKRS